MTAPILENALAKQQYLDEFETLLALQARSDLDFVFTGDCVECGNHNAFCQRVTLPAKDIDNEIWCIGCISLLRLKLMSWKSTGSVVNTNPPPVPNSPWGTAK